MTGRDWASISGLASRARVRACATAARRESLTPPKSFRCYARSANDVDRGMWRLVGLVRRTINGGQVVQNRRPSGMVDLERLAGHGLIAPRSGETALAVIGPSRRPGN